MARTQKITTHLWFNGNAEAAVEFYTSVFPNSRVTNIARWGEGGPGPQGAVLNIALELAGQAFLALNGGPQYTFTPAISLFVSCESQAEVDELWTKLLAGDRVGHRIEEKSSGSGPLSAGDGRAGEVKVSGRTADLGPPSFLVQRRPCDPSRALAQGSTMIYEQRE
jgi:predicted 3-demethylubiquinone-9 3-methyltransferase (glyoxalase superfamily)